MFPEDLVPFHSQVCESIIFWFLQALAYWGPPANRCTRERLQDTWGMGKALKLTSKLTFCNFSALIKMKLFQWNTWEDSIDEAINITTLPKLPLSTLYPYLLLRQNHQQREGWGSSDHLRQVCNILGNLCTLLVPAAGQAIGKEGCVFFKPSILWFVDKV